LTEAHSLPFLRESLLFLVFAGVLIPLLQRFRINQILGFLAVGVVVGPFGLARLTDTWPWLAHFTFVEVREVGSLAELGVIFLMFRIGLELSTERLWALRRWVFGAGGAQVLLTGVAIGLVAHAFGNDWKASLVLGLVLALSSTAVVVQLLTQKQALASPLGQGVFSVLMFQDLAVVPLLILVGLLAPGGADDPVSTILGTTALKSVVAIGLIFIVGRRLIRPVFKAFARQHQPEVFMALTLLTTMGMAALTAYAGLSMALGAFLAGLLLAETEYRHEVEVTIEPFKGLLMGLFFMSVGASVDPLAILRNPVWIPLSAVGLLALKAVVVTLIFRTGGLGWGRAVEGGLLLSQGGEFAFVVVGVATASGLMSGAVGQFMLLVVGLSLFVTPALARLGEHIRERLDRHNPPLAQDEKVPDDLFNQVIIAGFGRVGQLTSEVLRRQGVAFVAVEQDANRVAHFRNLGQPVYYGNAARPELLHRLHAERASLLIVTMDNPASALHTVKAVRQSFPHLPIVARSRDERHAQELLQAGAVQVIPETLEAGLQLSAAALLHLKLPEGVVTHAIDDERAQRVARLKL
jgi:monovalent cation:H+ antiporter-2, CPA2 family